MSSQPNYLRYFQEPRSKSGSVSLPSPSSQNNNSNSTTTNNNSMPSQSYVSDTRQDNTRIESNNSRPPSSNSIDYENENTVSSPTNNYNDYSRRSNSISTGSKPIGTPAREGGRPTSTRYPSPPRSGSGVGMVDDNADAPLSSSPPQDSLQLSDDIVNSPSAKPGKGLQSWLKSKRGAPMPNSEALAKDRVNLVNPQRTLSKELKNMVNNPDFCDVVFVLEEKPIYAHRAILAARSQKFQQMFNNIKEPRPEVIIPNIRYSVFLGMLYFLYTDSVDISLEYTLELMGAAAQFNLDLLKSLCERVLEGSIHVENVCWIFQGADRYKATRLRDICLRFVTRNFDLVSKSVSFAELDRDLILEIIKSR
eukprot:TRINITY_DN6337_c0_g1_i1.p1 TRINITY_DN6337_c0_g1~~TRINITY_DN6337_c0_g1_i1.p1  ORF type:complete len:365 (-),score=62.18 TRINITY_DN6337_c0_g1_i1:116-1210(-)